MKIRTDFVTNSSSSSYCVEVGVTLISGEKISYSQGDIAVWDEPVNPHIDLNILDCKKAKNLEALINLLHNAVVLAPNGYWDEYTEEFYEELNSQAKSFEQSVASFENCLRKKAKDLSDIRNVELSTIFYATGDQTGGDIDGQIHEVLLKIKKKYPNIDLNDQSMKADIIKKISTLLSKTDSLKNNDPEEFLEDYIDLLPKITEISAEGLDPVKSVMSQCYDFKEKKVSWRQVAYAGKKAER